MAIDAARLMEQLHASRSKTEMVLRGHLWIETALVGLIRATVERPEALSFDRMMFAQKLQIAHAIGAVHEPAMPWFRALNKTRNRLGHQLEGEPSDQQLREVAQQLSTHTRAVIKGIGEMDGTLIETPLGEFRWSVIAHLIELEHDRMLRTYERQYADTLNTFRLQVALKRIAHDQGGPEVDVEATRAALGLPPPPTARDALGNHEALDRAERDS